MSLLSMFEPLESRRLMATDLHAPVTAQAGGESSGANVTASARSNTFTDPRGDILPTYSGVVEPGMDVVAHQVTLAGERMIFFGKMAGPIAPTQEIGALYLFGVDRGRGTPRFLNPAARPSLSAHSGAR
jgi:hypothetical protein